MLNNPLTPSQILTIRQKLHMTQEEFANYIGITMSTISRWENGHSKPTRLATKTLLELKGRL